MAGVTTLFLPDGGLYIGELNKAGKPESTEASCAWPGGRSYIGSWIDGKMSGVGTLYENGKILKYGYWWNGELQHEFAIPTETPQPASPTSDTQSQGSPSPVQQEPASGENSSGQEPSPQRASHKMTALLIANNDYPEKPLRNCIKDAEALKKELASLNINVTLLRNATKKQMVAAIKSLESKARVYDHIFFFFSGHGVSNQGRHYLISVDENLNDANPLCMEEIDEFLSAVDFKNIIMASDACSVIVGGEGNTQMVWSAGRTLMAFSSSLGAIASDGIPNEHSPFAFGLLQYIGKPMSVVQMFQETNKFVMAYAREHSYYQQPVLIVSPYFPIEFRL